MGLKLSLLNRIKDDTCSEIMDILDYVSAFRDMEVSIICVPTKVQPS